MIKLSLNMMGIKNEQYESNPILKEIYNPEMFNIMFNPQNAQFYNQIFSFANNTQNNNTNENEKKEMKIMKT